MTYPPQSPWPPQPPPWPPVPMPPAAPAPRRGNKTVAWVILGVVVCALLVAGLMYFLGTGEQTKTVKDSALQRTLLTPAEAGNILGTPSLVGDPNYDDGAVQSTWDTERGNDPCVIGDPATAGWYQDTGSTAVRRQFLESPEGDGTGAEVLFDQAVIAYPDTDTARKVVEDIRGKWQQCVGQDVTQTFPDEDPWPWHIGDVAESDGVVVSYATDLSDDANGWVCHFGMAPRHNVVVQTQVCGTTANADFVEQLVAKMSQKVDTVAESNRSRHRHFRFGRHH
ncbi:sensor domain-containing protein [Mycolicibacterium peregrinum]|uniref:Sensor domain-containing protein n=1 Tax=Mycolicibacterium peregrinum TaxID=43304 RepID=A0A4Z0HWF0_MYCPR|nr:sensor domain-containing protein [Mycolicibacterium peregrinum]TGB36910.1 sensor domain-containing protein [Mycolicibacterium peregrinum]TGB46656.1 sensor domain-containing protein [Mycolicibacterium peregrinum]